LLSLHALLLSLHALLLSLHAPFVHAPTVHALFLLSLFDALLPVFCFDTLESSVHNLKFFAILCLIHLLNLHVFDEATLQNGPIFFLAHELLWVQEQIGGVLVLVQVQEQIEAVLVLVRVQEQLEAVLVLVRVQIVHLHWT
jgi:hypothetical protein